MARAAVLLLCAACARDGMLRIKEELPRADTVQVAALYLLAERGDRGTQEGADAVTAANFARLARLVRFVARRGARVIVTPEYGVIGGKVPRDSKRFLSTSLPAAPTPGPFWEERDPGIAPVLRDFARLSDEVDAYLVVHYLERVDDLYYPVSLAFDPGGRLLAAYRKRVLWPLTESDKASGSEPVSFDTPWGRFGMLVCSDAIGPVTWLDLKRKHDVDYFVCQSRWFPAPLTGRLAMSIVANATRRPVVWANERQFGLAGGAGIVRPWARDSVIRLGGRPGAVVANLRLPARLRAP